MTTQTKPYNSITLREAASLLSAAGDKVSFLFSGEMGIGKSSILKMLKAEHGDAYWYSYLDMTTLDVGDLWIPKIIETKQGQEQDSKHFTRFAPNEAFGFHQDKPVILMLDEIGKASKAVLNASLRILLERALGDNALPPGSIVFATTNLAIEGLGDSVQAHARNRLCQAKIRKPTGAEWVEDYALNAGIHPVVLGTAIEFPSMFESFENVPDPNDNHYIHHPKQPRAAFVTPRSLEKASDIIKGAENQNTALPPAVLAHALIGVIGEKAAMDMLTIHQLNETLPSYERIALDPENAPIPSNGAAACMVIAKTVQRVEREEMDNVIKYIKRFPTELQALWMRSIMRGEKRNIAVTHAAFTALAGEKMYLFT